MAEAYTERPMLEMRGITKRFPGVLALDNVDFSVRRGEIHSLIGQNGAGKSTLMKILAGDYPPNEGEILIDGHPVIFRQPREARALKISIVYQELSLLRNLTVADNIYLGREPGRQFVIDQGQVVANAKRVLEQLGVDSIDVTEKVGTLPLAKQQLVEIAKALSHQPKILILDEPTAALAPGDAALLFRILHRLKEQGIAIIYISHHLREIIEHCDRGTILRNGRVVETVTIDENTSEQTLISLMLGQETESFYRRSSHDRTPADRDVLLEVRDLSVDHKVRDVSFSLRRGEILGITGLLGAGQNELARVLGGSQQQISGWIFRNGRALCIATPRDAIDQGICLVTENRKEEGLFLDMTVKENITIASLHRFLISRVVPFLATRRESRAVAEYIGKLNLVLSSPQAKIQTLSGGNQQKAILARWLLRDLEIFVFIEPTRGIDVGAKAEIYRHLDTLAKEGRGIIVISPELTEILGISDRILVMYGGRLVQEFRRGEATEELLLAAIQGTLGEKSNNRGGVGDGRYPTDANVPALLR